VLREWLATLGREGAVKSSYSDPFDSLVQIVQMDLLVSALDPDLRRGDGGWECSAGLNFSPPVSLPAKPLQKILMKPVFTRNRRFADLARDVRIAVPALAGLLCAVQVSAQPASSESSPEPSLEQWQLLDQYCSDCHNLDDFAGGVAFDLLTPASIPDEAATFEEALRKLRGRLMPPPGSEQPAQADIDTFVAWLEGTLDAAATAHPGAGHVPVQRLNRTEYALAVKDLLGVDLNPADLLPADIEVDGFDNIAAALSVSPSFVEQYIGAARTAARLAIGEPVPKLANVYYPSPGGSQAQFEDGMPLGTRGGMKVKHPFMADGEYRINILDLDVGLYPRAAETPQTVVVLVGGREVYRADVGGYEDIAIVDRLGAEGRGLIMARFNNIPFTAKAGMHDVIVTFIERSRAESDWNVGSTNSFGGMRVARVLDGIEVLGPYNASGVSMTPSRQKIFVCQPAAANEEQACAERIIANLARKAFRRDVSAADIAAYIPFYEAGRATAGGFDAGIEQVVAAILATPDFLYRGIAPANDLGPSQTFALNDLELASRLSFFLWSIGPDDTLLQLAEAGELRSGTNLQQQVQRMLADPRAEALVNNFALKWLNLDSLDAVDPEPQQFPGFNDALKDDFSEELRLFLASVLLGERPVHEMLTASHSFLNERLARHYGIEDVHGAQFRRVELADERRWGILGKSAMLLRTSYGDRTSPVLRGAWVLEKLMGTPPTPPPPNVETDLSVPEGELPTTVRARLEQHRDNPSCNQCHGVIDPIGLALENFTVTGQWRDIDRQANAAIDASTVLPNGTAINGPVELRQQLAQRPEQFALALTEKLLMYAVNRELEHFDMPQVRSIVRAAAADQYRLSALVLGIVQNPAFQLQALPESSTQVAKAE
jgi:mono/diheme cytochrome c family protein